MSEVISVGVPAGFVAGDSVKWRLRTVIRSSHRDPADGWVLTYSLVSPVVQHAITGTDNGDGYHLVSLSAATTAGYAPGLYEYQGYVTKAGERLLADQGRLCVEPNFATVSQHDGRVWARRVLDAIEATIEGKAPIDQQAYTLEGRSVQRLTWDELLNARARLRRELRALEQATAVAKGRHHSGIIRTRL